MINKGYYVGLITFCSLLIVLVEISKLISKLIKILNLERERWSREKNRVDKILKFCLKLYLKSPVLRFKKTSLWETLD